MSDAGFRRVFDEPLRRLDVGSSSQIRVARAGRVADDRRQVDHRVDAGDGAPAEV